jgi:hypothetical protein
VPSKRISEENTAVRLLDLKARQKIGHELRATYDDCREWELPKRLTELLERFGTGDHSGRMRSGGGS